jgi:hypothetical protein
VGCVVAVLDDEEAVGVLAAQGQISAAAPSHSSEPSRVAEAACCGSRPRTRCRPSLRGRRQQVSSPWLEVVPDPRRGGCATSALPGRPGQAAPAAHHHERRRRLNRGFHARTSAAGRTEFPYGPRARIPPRFGPAVSDQAPRVLRAGTQDAPVPDAARRKFGEWSGHGAER